MSRRAAALVLLLLGPLSAQSTNYQIQTRGDGVRRPTLSVRVLCPSPSAKGSGLGFARIELDNVSGEALQLRVSTRHDYATTFEASHGLNLAPGGAARFYLPVLGEDPGLRIEVERDPSDQRSIGSRGSLHGIAALHVATDGAAAADWKTLLETELAPVHAVTTGGARARVELPVVSPDDLPPDARWLSGYDLILVDAAVPGLSGEIQERLVQYVAGGGALLLYQGEALAAGPLATMAAATGAGRHGLGTWLRTEGRSDAATEQKLRPWLAHPRSGPKLAAEQTRGAPSRAGLHTLLRIPGLGEVPVWGFLLLITGFVWFVAREMVGVLRKRLRPTRMLLVLPITGISFALLILGYGVLSEGFGVRGTMWSFTRLDQRNHVAASVATRTLYAGLSPSALTPSPDTLLLCSAQQGRGARGPELRLDLDRGGRVDGSILPSRTATGLISSTVGRARERLRFRRRADGGLDLLAGPELAPCAGVNAVVVCDFAGTTYALGADRRLAPVKSVSAALANACRGLEAMDQISDSTPTRGWVTHWLEGQIGTQLAPGTYLAWVESPPAFDRLGLDVDYRGSVHLVLGTLAPEDILD